MPTPPQGYYNSAGKRLPSVTTIIGRFKDGAALSKWQFRMGFEQGTLHGLGKPYVDDSYAIGRDAADVGTLVHALVEDHILGRESALAADIDPRIRSGFEAYRSWERQSRLKIVATETRLVSEAHQFGGTPDAVGELEGQLVLLDWKTSNAVYVDHLVQLAAYRMLWNECRPDTPITGGSHLLRFSKEEGDFAHHYYPNLDDAEEQFLLFRRAYVLDQKLKRRV